MIMRKVVEQACILLKCRTTDISILNMPSYGIYYNNIRWFTRPISTTLLVGDFYDSSRPLHGKKEIPRGLTVYEVNGEFKIVVANFFDMENRTWICDVILEKQFTYKFASFMRKRNPPDKFSQKPLLEKDTLQKIQENIISFFPKNKRIKRQYDKNIVKGFLFQGPPGNGKSLTCAWILKELNCTSSWIKSKKLIELLENDKKVFEHDLTIIDDIEVSLLNRKNSGPLSCSFLSELDGDKKAHGCLRILTTNEQIDHDIEDAFLRPGRIDHVIKFEPPTRELRHQFVIGWPEKIYKEIERHVKYIMEHTESFSFAQMEAVLTNLILQKELFDDPFDIGKAIFDVIDNRVDNNKTPIGFT